jgi:hypothetical protein
LPGIGKRANERTESGASLGSSYLEASWNLTCLLGRGAKGVIGGHFGLLLRKIKLRVKAGLRLLKVPPCREG